MSKKNTLKIIAHGAGITFIGSIFAYFIAFLYRIVIARYLGPADYGLLTLAVAIVGIGRTVSSFGLNAGIKRYIGYYSGKKDNSKISGLIFYSLKLVMLTSLIIASFIWFFSSYIAVNLLHSPQLASILKIFAIVIPLNALIELIKSILLSFNKPVYSSGIEIIGEKSFSLLFTIIAILGGAKLYGVSIAYMLSYLVTMAIAIYLLEFKVYASIRSNIKAYSGYKELLSFSLPLLFTGMLNLILGWSDTFMLGIFKESLFVGIYNIGFSLGYSLLLISRSFEALSYPISANLLAQKKFSILKNTFQVITKWTFAMTFPLFLLIIFFSKDILRILFGYEYQAAAGVLIIISAGIFSASVFYAPVILLQTFKKTGYIFKITFISASINILLNLILIPLFGIEGAALSTAFSWNLTIILQYLKISRIINLWFTKKIFIAFVKYTVSGLSSLVIVFILLRILFGYLNIYEVIFGLALFIFFYAVFLLLLRSFSKEDIMIMLAIEKRLGLNLGYVKIIIQKFL